MMKFTKRFWNDIIVISEKRDAIAMIINYVAVESENKSCIH